MRQVNLHISMRVRRQRLLVCRCMSLIREVLEGYLQQLGEYSPPRVEGVLFSSSAAQVHDKGKRPMQDEEPSGGQDIDFILIDEELGSPSSKLREVVQEKKAEINTLSVKLQRAQWIIN